MQIFFGLFSIIPIFQAQNEARLKDLEGRVGTGAREEGQTSGRGWRGVIGDIISSFRIPSIFWHRKCVRVPDGVVHGFGDRGPELGRAARQQGRREIITKFTRCRSDWMVRENERFRTSPLEPPQNLNAGQLCVCLRPRGGCALRREAWGDWLVREACCTREEVNCCSRSVSPDRSTWIPSCEGRV